MLVVDLLHGAFVVKALMLYKFLNMARIDDDFMGKFLLIDFLCSLKLQGCMLEVCMNLLNIKF